MPIKIGRAWRGLTAAGAFIGALSIASTALAGKCPADKMAAGFGNPGHGPKSVTDQALKQIREKRGETGSE